MNDDAADTDSDSSSAARPVIGEAPGAYFPLTDPGPLAEPWRRLLAAALDTALVLVVATLILTCSFAYSSDYTAIIADVQRWIAPIVWLCVIAGWTLGATPGMRLLGIKLVSAQTGGQPGLGRAVRRSLGFCIACLPVKCGLIPILSHPLRQGWHDRIADTLVVKKNASVPEGYAHAHAAPRRSLGEGMPAPDIGYAFKGLPLAIVLFSAVTLILTWPVAAHMTTRIPGVLGDNYFFSWGYWYVNYCLSHHHDPIASNLASYPLTMPMTYSTIDWLAAVMARPFLFMFGPVVAYNLVWLITLTLCQAGVYMLTAAVVRSRAAGIAVAPIYGLSPYFMAHGLGHMHMISGEFLPPFLLCVYAALTTGRVRYGFWAGLWMGLSCNCDMQYFVIGITGGLALVGAYWWGAERIDLDKLRAHALAALAAGAVCFALIAWYVVPGLSYNARTHDNDRQVAFFATPAEYFTPSGMQWFERGSTGSTRGMPVEDVEKTVTIGIVAIGLAFLALLSAVRDNRSWWLVLACAFVFSLGTFMATDSPLLSSAASLIATGFPGCGFSLPWHFDPIMREAQTLAGSDFNPFKSVQVVWLPYAWVRTVIPPIRPFRATDRFAILVLAAVAVLAGSVVAWLIEWTKKKGGRFGPVFVSGIVLVALCCEYDAFPFPLCAYPRNPVLRTVAQLCGGGVHPVLNIPLGPDLRYEIEQTVYQQPQFAGIFSREPDSALDFVSANPVLEYAASYGGAAVQMVKDSDLSASRLRQGLEQLRALQTRVVLVHKDLLTAAQVAHIRSVFKNTLHACVVAEDAEYIVYDISGATSPSK